MIKVNGNVWLNIRPSVESGSVTKDLDQYELTTPQSEVIGFRMVLTAGFCLPTVQMILFGTQKDFYESLNMANGNVIVQVGSSPNDMDVFTVKTVGHHLQSLPDEGKYLLSWGGVIVKNNLNDDMFLYTKGNAYNKGTALEVLQKVWKEETGCDIISEVGSESMQIEHPYKREKKTLNNYLVDILLHVDKRPSFPLATIDRNCNLVLKDFQTVKKNGPVATLLPAHSGMQPTKESTNIVIPYQGKPESISYKPYSNRACGYTQVTGRDKDGNVSVAVDNLAEGWLDNKLSTSLVNDASTLEYMKDEVFTSHITSETPIAYDEIALHNKKQSLNMSSISTRVRVDGKYLNNIGVLDLVKLKTGGKEDKTAGNYLIEAMEIGVVQGSEFTNVLWLCRDNHNDVENTQIDNYRQSVLKALRIDSSTKTNIIKRIRQCRSGLARSKSVMDGTLVNNWERYLISLKSTILSNYNVVGTNINFNNRTTTISSLQSLATNLENSIISHFVKSPYDMFFKNVLSSSNTSLFSVFMAIMSAILGGQLYNEFASLIADLKYFSTFLDSYSATTSQVAYQYSSSYVADVVLGVLTFDTSNTNSGLVTTSSASSSLSSTSSSVSGLTTVTADATTASEESKMATKEKLVDEILSNIPDSVDIPIPEITLSDSDLLKSEDEIKEIIVDAIIEDLIDRGYIYDSFVVDADGASNYSKITIADGTEITYATARSTMVPSATMTEILLGNQALDATVQNRIESAIGTTLKIRHWGTFFTEDELLSFNINRSYTDKYKTVNTIKLMSVTEGRRVFVALPASEYGTIFYINSDLVTMNEMDVADLGYYDSRGKAIPYVIYYTTEGYNSSNLTLELRKGG